MTTITDKITGSLEILQCFEDPQELSTIIRNDLLGFSKNVPIKKISKRFGLDPLDLQQGMDALAYLILHIAKVKANQEEFEIIFEQSGLKPQFKKPFFDAVFPHINELREILNGENESDIKRFKDFDWKMSLVTGCRARQKIMVPKYTLKLDIAEGQSQHLGDQNNQNQVESFVMDCDYTNLKRIQQELEEALKSIDTTYSKKVFKFLK
eukprot:403376539